MSGNWMTCPYCKNTDLKEKNYESHLKRVHPSEYREEFGGPEREPEEERVSKDNATEDVEDHTVDGELTVLSDWSEPGEQSHRESANHLLYHLREEMSDEEWWRFGSEIRTTVVDLLLSELRGNLGAADWHGMGFEEPTDYLDAVALVDAISSEAKWYFEDDQTGKSWDVMQVIFEHAEEHGLVERVEES